jgi:hypothetical protein
VNDEYTKTLKNKATETVFIEKNVDRLLFTNSCWELQRVNQFKGGNLILDEVYRFRHVGTGKFLAVDAEDSSKLTLINTQMSLETLFCFKSEMQTKKDLKYVDEEEDEDQKFKKLKSGQRIMIMSYFEEKYLQLFDDLDDYDFELFKNKKVKIDAPFDDKSSMLSVINHRF